ncbi:MAG: hypothetical protein U0R64_01860 [Candidatus Nanopelagicales bacterium]
MSKTQKTRVAIEPPTSEARRGHVVRRRVVIVLSIVVAVACFGGAIVWRSSAAQPVSIVGTWQLASVQHRDGPRLQIPAKADAYMEVDSAGLLSGKDGVGALQGDYTITGDQLRVRNVVVAAIARAPSLPVYAFDELFDEASIGVVTVTEGTLAVATADYTMTFEATTPKVEVTPTLISPSPQP